MSDVASLSVSEVHFRILVEQASDAFFLHDFDGRIVDVNNRACESLGYTRDELLRFGILDLELDFDLTLARQVWDRIEPGATTVINGRQRRKDGTIFPTEGRLSTCEVGGQSFILGLVRDISDRKQAEDALRRSEIQYRTLFNSIDEAFCLIRLISDASGKFIDYVFLDANPAFARHVGIPEAVGHTIRELVPGIEQRWVDIYGDIVLTRRPARFREHSPSLNRWFDVHAFPVGEEDDRTVAVLFANITDRVVAEEALKKSEKLALVGRMAGIITHEIRNPLESVSNLLYLTDTAEDPEAMRGYVQMAQEELNRMSSIVTQTLKFNRESQVPARDKLSSILDSALTLFRARIRQFGINVRLDFHDEDEIICLSSELRQVFANLIGNAIEATESGGTVTVRTHPCHFGSPSQPGIRVTVADTGTGMSAETLKHLFQAFYTTKGQQGTGLGLWVSQEILARHGVTVRVKSCPSSAKHGTVFCLWFPMNFPTVPSLS